MNVACVTTGAGHHQGSSSQSNEQQFYVQAINNNQNQNARDLSRKRTRSGEPSVSGSAVSTMRSTATVLPVDHQKGTDLGKGHYGSSTMELYFAWFSAITFVLELAIGKQLG